MTLSSSTASMDQLNKIEPVSASERAGTRLATFVSVVAIMRKVGKSATCIVE